ncbi:MAG: hypothetical protein ACD_78C00048G0002 [uncultured bacterium (gcode 4)]|uniref:Uncharacterized protein n=1 Tax=uncultured bacterium (gcode 4) TaxID=1234023 RepID=K1YDY5_9BACT|nr:MAG: hypothetical protein ACD_78C00048G0002 [uncultured bacterium (gcode 4)]
MNISTVHIEFQEKKFTSLCNLLLEGDGIAIISLFALTSHNYWPFFCDIVPLARTVPKEKFLAAYEDFKQRWFISTNFQTRIDFLISRVQEINEGDMKEEYKKILLESLEKELGDFVFWENEWLFDKKILAQFWGGKKVSELNIENGEISFLISSHKAQERTVSAVESII